MFGKIKFISGNVAHVETVCSAEEMGDLMNVHVVKLSVRKRLNLWDHSMVQIF